MQECIGCAEGSSSESGYYSYDYIHHCGLFIRRYHYYAAEQHAREYAQRRRYCGYRVYCLCFFPDCL